MPRVAIIYISIIIVRFIIMSGQMRPDSLIDFIVFNSTARISSVSDTF